MIETKGKDPIFYKEDGVFHCQRISSWPFGPQRMMKIAIFVGRR
jgi:hypothetical protein